MPSGAGPGAGSPASRSSARHTRFASVVVTFCSRTAGTSASQVRSVRLSRSHGVVRCSRLSSGWPAQSSAPASSAAPSHPGPAGRPTPRPDPQAWMRTSPPATVRRTVAAPSGVVVTRHVPSGANRSVGSPTPRRCTPSVRRTSSGQSGRKADSKAGAVALRTGLRGGAQGALRGARGGARLGWSAVHDGTRPRTAVSRSGRRTGTPPRRAAA